MTVNTQAVVRSPTKIQIFSSDNMRICHSEIQGSNFYTKTPHAPHHRLNKQHQALLFGVEYFTPLRKIAEQFSDSKENKWPGCNVFKSFN